MLIIKKKRKKKRAALPPLLDIYTKEPKSAYNSNICTPMFIVALFTTPKIWNQPRCSLIDGWIKKIWYI
jgi:hypothetical protein